MAGYKGKDLVIKKAAVAICAGVMSKDIKYNGEPIDISSDDDSGWRTMMSDVGLRSVDISFEGVTKDAVLRTIKMSGACMLTDASVLFPNGDTLTGNFFLAGYSEKGETNGAIKFSAELQSSGPMVFTPAT